MPRWSLPLLALVAAVLAPGVPAAEGRWRIDPVVSEAGFAVRVLWVRKVGGEFSPLEGFVYHDPDSGQADVEVRIDTRNLRMRNPSHADWARSEEFFDAARHPWIHFQSAPFELDRLRTGGTLWGTLTLRGRSGPVQLELQPSDCPRPGFDCPVRASGDLERSAFGMTARRYAVADKVELSFAIRVSEDTSAAAATGGVGE